MKRKHWSAFFALALVALLLTGCSSMSASSASVPTASAAPAETLAAAYESAEGKQIRLTTANSEVIVTLNGSRAASDLVAMLPLELTLIERNSFAKGMTLPESLSAEEPTTRSYQIGDFGYWDAGPDLAIFYDDIYEQTVVPVIPLGHAESGAETLANEEGTIRLELVTDDEPEEATAGGKTLIVYFSVMETDGVDTVGGASRVATADRLFGNNEYVAQLIAQQTGGDVFAIETVQDYPTTHQPLLEFGHAEQANGTKPTLATHIEHLEDYDTIFLGYPIWNADLPMPLYSFLEEYDFSGKTIIPFTVHGGSGFAGTPQIIAALEPNATVITDGLSISRGSVADAEASVVQWVQRLGLTQ